MINIDRLKIAGAALVSCMLFAVFPAVGIAQSPSGADPSQAAKKSIVVGYGHNRHPLHYIDSRNRLAGFDVDFTLAVAGEAGLDVSEVRPGTQEELLKDLAEGRIDLLAGIYQTADLAAACDFATPYKVVQHSLFVAEGSPIKSLDEARGKVVAVERNGAAGHFLAKEKFADRVMAVESVADALRLLAARGCDCAILPADEGSSLASRLHKGAIFAVGAPIFRAEYGFVVKKGNQDLRGALNNGISAAMTSGRFKELENRWFGQYADTGGIPAGKLAAIAGAVVAAAIFVVLARAVLARRIKSRVAAATGSLERSIAALKQEKEKTEGEKQGLLAMVRNAPYGIAVTGGPGRESEVIYLNAAAEKILGYELGSLKTIGEMIEALVPDSEYRERIMQRWENLAKENFKDGGFTLSCRVRSGATIRIDFRAAPMDDGRVEIMFYDATEKLMLEEERQRLDEQIRQSQKLEAMGHLAGGVAHDFNNILTPILGNAQLLQMDISKDTENGTLLSEIVSAAKRAGDLTKQLLAYARKGKFQIVPVDVHETIREVVSLLGHSVDRLIEIKTDMRADKPVIMGDPSQLQGALLNLGVNARDAMPEGGVMTYATRMVSVDKEMCRKRSYDIVPGEYLEIRVSDTGIGMTKETRSRLFEPFFTTKKPGKGTGLGLASVYGCVKNHHGAIEVSTELGKGTVFSVIVPSVGAKLPDGEMQKSAEMVHGKGHVLIVDDEDVVRTFTSKALTKLGYKVSSCVDGAKAVEFYRENYRDIDIVVMDLIMPNMDGRTAFAEMKKINPEIKLVVASGFAADKTAVECMQQGALDFIAKPFRVEELSQAIAAYIGRSPEAASGQQPPVAASDTPPPADGSSARKYTI